MQTVKLSLILLLVMLSGCFENQERGSLASLNTLQVAEPVKDADYSIARNDLRFIAVHNHDLTMPLNIRPCLVERFGYRILSNQSFDYGSYDFQKYGALATLYSNWYNFTLLSHLDDNDLATCYEGAEE